MKFLATLQNTKPSALTLVDMANIITILPLFIVLKVPMIFFLVVMSLFILIRKTPLSQKKTLFVLVFGILTMYLSLYGEFNLQGLSRLKLFLELLIYILLTVVAMQRLTREINFYLIMSPMLFLALSLFFFHGLLMLIYVIFEIFFLLWMILSHRMESTLIQSFRKSIVMFMYSLPWVVVLFIFFPRISFEHASYGFKGEKVQRMGHDGTMFLDNNALLVPSGRIVMEINFEKKLPKNEQLYFRGSMLYVDKKNHWEPIPSYLHRDKRVFYFNQGEKSDYIVTLYPTHKKWLYLLDMPQNEVKNTLLDHDLITTSKKNIIEPLHYKATSSLSDVFREKIDKTTKKYSLQFHKDSNPKTYAKAEKIRQLSLSNEEKAQEIVKFFRQQKLTYTLKPKALDINNTTDSFLFGTRLGYCVHFSSSFVTMARMVGIPSRIVTGYKASLSNGYKKYLSIKESDAHAWAELYLGDHWKRFETTAYATVVKQTPTQIKEKKKNQFLKKLNLYLRYVKYQVETWILDYSNIRQLQLIKYAKNHPSFIFAFVITLLSLFIGSLIVVSYFKKERQDNEILALLTPLLKRLEEEGFKREEQETLHHYFQRYQNRYSKQTQKCRVLLEIDKTYEEILYANNHSLELKKRLKVLVKAFLKLSKRSLLSLFK